MSAVEIVDRWRGVVGDVECIVTGRRPVARVDRHSLHQDDVGEFQSPLERGVGYQGCCVARPCPVRCKRPFSCLPWPKWRLVGPMGA